MTPESESLQHFLQTNLAHKFTHIKQHKLSDESKMFLESIIKKIVTADNDFDYTDIVTGNNFENFSPKGIHYKLCPQKARNHIENMMSIGQSCRFSIKQRKINIHMVY
jgi:hypothetical protein